jgi:hypothetical protein
MDEVPVGLDPGRRRWEMTFNVDARMVDGSLKTGTVDWDGKSHMTLVCDEGPAVGGRGSAPTPLMFFSAALAF